MPKTFGNSPERKKYQREIKQKQRANKRAKVKEEAEEEVEENNMNYSNGQG